MTKLAQYYGLVFGGLFLILLVHVFINYMSLSIVEFSHTTGECMQVVVGEGSCDNLPERYIHQWVK